jgi:hypothetical protein
MRCYFLHNNTFGSINDQMYNNVRIQFPLGLKRKFSFSHLRENFRIFAKIFAKISLRKLTKIAETLVMWTVWGMGH